MATLWRFLASLGWLVHLDGAHSWNPALESNYEREREDTVLTALAVYNSSLVPRLTKEGISVQRLDQSDLKLLQQLCELPLEHWEREVDGPNLRNTAPSHAPTYVMDMPQDIETAIRLSVAKMIANWTGRKMKWSNRYGPRMYTNGSVLLKHVDNPYQIASAVVNIATEVG